MRPIVGADETRLLMQNDGTGKPKNGFVWTFVAPDENGETDVQSRSASPAAIATGMWSRITLTTWSGA